MVDQYRGAAAEEIMAVASTRGSSKTVQKLIGSLVGISKHDWLDIAGPLLPSAGIDAFLSALPSRPGEDTEIAFESFRVCSMSKFIGY